MKVHEWLSGPQFDDLPLQSGRVFCPNRAYLCLSEDPQHWEQVSLALLVNASFDTTVLRDERQWLLENPMSYRAAASVG